MKPFQILLYLLLGAESIEAQASYCPPRDCDCIRQKADSALANGDFEAAVNKLLAWRTCAPKKAAKADSLVLVVFKNINDLKTHAENQALTTYANDLAYKSTTALHNGDRNTALRLAEFTHRYVQADNPNVARAFVEALYYNDNPDPARPPLPGEVMTLSGHTSAIGGVAFSPDGKRLATAGVGDKIAKIWDMESGKATMTLNGHYFSVVSVAFSPDGKRLATAGAGDKTAKIWDLESGKATMTLSGHTSYVWSVAFSPDGKRLATAGVGDKTAKIWDLESGKETMSLSGHTSNVRTVAFSPDGKRLATGSDDNTAKIWDLESGKETMSLSEHSSKVWSVAFSPDGKRLATGAGDNTAKIWVLTPEGWWDSPKGRGRRLAGLEAAHLTAFSLEKLLDQHLGNEQKLIATREVWQIKAFADLAASQAGGSNILSKVEPIYAPAERLYAAALALQDELLIRMDYAKMLRRWAGVYKSEGQTEKAAELEGKADGLWRGKNQD
ncbi:MAG: WD40 repeat domain-containing protein [Saprospiraceae bacterium]